MCALGDASHHTGSCLVSPAKVEVLHAMAMMKTPQSGGSDAASAHAMSMVQTPCASEAPSPLAMSMVQTPRSGGSEAPSSRAVSMVATPRSGGSATLPEERLCSPEVISMVSSMTALEERDDREEEEQHLHTLEFIQAQIKVAAKALGDEPLPDEEAEDLAAEHLEREAGIVEHETACMPCDGDEAPTSAAPHASSLCVPFCSCATAGQSTSSKAMVKLSDVQRQPGTLKDWYAGFRCGCDQLKGGVESCLDHLSHAQLKSAYQSMNPQGADTPPSTFRTKLHECLWQRKEKLPAANGYGHSFKITNWLWDGVPLCRQSFVKMVHGTAHTHREVTSLVLQGISPNDLAQGKAADLLAASAAKAGGEMTEKQAFATQWLAERYLTTMEFMPNENRIMLRGVGLPKVWSKQYCPLAVLEGKKLSYKQFAACLPAATFLCAKQNHCTETEAAQCKATRSARHSKFAMCSSCHQLRTDYVKTASNPLADKVAVAEKLARWMAHQNQFMKDRQEARNERLSTTMPGSHTRYECDDKCGSHWCKCPVLEGGRDSKFTATRCYEFAVQANVVCGREGVMRLAIVPKTVSTGANFGLSTLLYSLAAICCVKDGRSTLPTTVWRLMRHTDGGPDNVSKLTHIFHWLLVYLGCWQDLWWFMFDAGHSHTEVADRLFALMKKLFETDNATAVEGNIRTFEELEDKLKETFATNPEMKEIVYHFANWNINDWLKGVVRFRDQDLQHISFDKVYRYEYVADAKCVDTSQCRWRNDASRMDDASAHLPEKHCGCRPSTMAELHGGVKVTYKAHLSDTTPMGGLDAEWAPVRRVTEWDASGCTQLQANRTTEEGVLFVSAPPDLTTEPKREAIPPKCGAREVGPRACQHAGCRLTRSAPPTCVWTEPQRRGRMRAPRCCSEKTSDTAANGPFGMPSMPCTAPRAMSRRFPTCPVSSRWSATRSPRGGWRQKRRGQQTQLRPTELMLPCLRLPCQTPLSFASQARRPRCARC